jgi:hypothetical protein
MDWCKFAEGVWRCPLSGRVFPIRSVAQLGIWYDARAGTTYTCDSLRKLHRCIGNDAVTYFEFFGIARTSTKTVYILSWQGVPWLLHDSSKGIHLALSEWGRNTRNKEEHYSLYVLTNSSKNLALRDCRGFQQITTEDTRFLERSEFPVERWTEPIACLRIVQLFDDNDK